jgi:biotin carboxyl carrier protein
MHLAFRHGGEHLVIDIRRSTDGKFVVDVNGESQEVEAALVTPTALRTTIAGRTHLMHVAKVGAAYHVALDGATYVLEPDIATSTGGDTSVLNTPMIVAPMPGKVLKVLVAVGQHVAAGDPLLILEAMKMETRITAEGPAVVRRIAVETGQMIDAGMLLVELEPVSAPISD